jgi:hypothetical protein
VKTLGPTSVVHTQKCQCFVIITLLKALHEICSIMLIPTIIWVVSVFDAEYFYPDDVDGIFSNLGWYGYGVCQVYKILC